MSNIVIASAVRTAGGSFGGSLKSKTATDLGAAVVAEAVRRAGIAPSLVDQTILGNGWQAGVGPNPARIASVQGGCPVETPAFTVNIRCGSGLRAVQLGALSIAGGENEIVVAGGMESSTNVPYLLPQARWGQRMGDKPTRDALHTDGFNCKLAGMFMGDTAGLLVQKYGLTREEQDTFAMESHRKACAAIDRGDFKKEILPIEIVSKKGTVVFDTDEIPRRDASVEKMGKLPGVFKVDPSITAGNSCALCDGASAVVLMTEEKAHELDVAPLARIRSYAYAGVDPKYMGIGPIPAIRTALARAGMQLSDIDLIELNEAFAAQVLACDRELSFDRSRLNVNGGAIALGHPVGATGAKLLTSLVYALQARELSTGLVSLCIGGGQGVAMIVERI